MNIEIVRLTLVKNLNTKKDKIVKIAPKNFSGEQNVKKKAFSQTFQKSVRRIQPFGTHNYCTYIFKHNTDTKCQCLQWKS